MKVIKDQINQVEHIYLDQWMALRSLNSMVQLYPPVLDMEKI